MQNKKKIVIFDSNAVIHRAYHALPPFHTNEGTLVNAVYGYSNLLMKVIKDLKPDAILASFDVSEKTFRHEQYQEYKAGRQKTDQELYDQIPLVKEILTYLDIPILEYSGFEADDIIGTIAERVTKSEQFELIIVTGDMDTMQLVNSKVKVYALRKSVTDTILYDEAQVMEKYQFTPEQVIDYKGLKGDSSDNIPGVPGIGDKRAIGLLNAFQNIDNLYKFLDKYNNNTEIPVEYKSYFSNKIFSNLKEYKAQAFFSRELATIIRNVPIELDLNSLHNYIFSTDKAKQIFSKFEFHSLVKRLSEMQDVSQSSFFDTNLSESQSLPLTTEFDTLDKDNLALFQNELGCFFIDKRQKYKTSIPEIKEILKKDITIIGYNLKAIFRYVFWGGKVYIKAKYHDISIMAYLLYSGEKFDLESLSYKYKIDFDRLNPEKSLLELYNKINLELIESDLMKIYSEIENPLIEVLAQMEINGVYLNTDDLTDIKNYVDKRLLELEQEIYTISNIEFNLNSPKQLAEILFDKLQISTNGLKKTSTGFITTSSETLEKLQQEHIIIDKIIEYRELAKLKSTYIDTLPEVRDEQGRIHTDYSQIIAATGRLSSINPNLQNIPARTDLGNSIKQCFQAEQGSTLLIYDYSQIELRLAAHLSQDESMIEIFNQDIDFHTATASKIYSIPQAMVNKEMRNFAKTINFGILYGMGFNALSKNLKITKSEAKEFISKYNETYPDLQKYIIKQKEFAIQHGYAITEYGRKRNLSKFDLKNPKLRAQMERIAVNMPIQGLQADIIKIAMIRINDLIKGSNEIKLLLQIHDELVFEVLEDKTLEWKDLIHKVMEDVYKIKVKLKVNYKIQKKWGNE